MLARLCNIIKTRTSAAYAFGVSKRDYDDVIPRHTPLRGFCGDIHYTFAVRQLATTIGEWRRKYHRAASMKYIFDHMQGKVTGKGEIMAVMDGAIARSQAQSKVTGVPPLTGYSFESKSTILPLQAADILAWTVFQQLQKKLSGRKPRWEAQAAWDHLSSTRSEFQATFFTREHLEKWVTAYIKRLFELHQHGKLRIPLPDDGEIY